MERAQCRRTANWEGKKQQPMKLIHALSAFITAEPWESLPKRTATILIPGATIGTTSMLAVTAAGHGPLPQQLAETLVTEAGDHAGINIQAAVYAGVMLYARRSHRDVDSGKTHEAPDRRRRGARQSQGPSRNSRPGSRTSATGGPAIFVEDGEGNEANRRK